MVELLFISLFFGFGLLLPWATVLYRRCRVSGAEAASAAIDARPFLHSLLAYVLAFNLTFFIQELFLVLPKAMVPGLQPTLYHNNHRWEGDAEVASLFQGTGALAILLSGLIFCWIVSRQRRPSLLPLWMAFHGLFQGLPQFVVGAFAPGNDIGQAYDYLELGTVGEGTMALIALLALPASGLWLGRQFLRSAWREVDLGDPRLRFGFLLRIATWPALSAIPLIILYRVPRELVEVVASPLLVPMFGCGWLQLAAFHHAERKGDGPRPTAIAGLSIAAIALLAIFQLVLRQGIPF